MRSEGRPNEALQQTRSALTTVAAALAAERRCWTDLARTATVTGLVVLAPRLVMAEVMDKEVPVSEIWLATAAALLLVPAVGLLWRWLLSLTFPASLLAGPALAWVEWHDPYVGADIAREAGEFYGQHAQGAVLVLLVVHASLWLFFSARARSRQTDGGVPPADLAEAGKTVLFACGLALSLILFAASGFGPAQWVWSSPPLLVAETLLAASALWWTWCAWGAA